MNLQEIYSTISTLENELEESAYNQEHTYILCAELSNLYKVLLDKYKNCLSTDMKKKAEYRYIMYRDIINSIIL